MWSWIKRIFLLALCLALLASAGLGWYALSPVTLRTDPADFSIRPGSSLRSATRQMVESGVELNAWQFNLLGRLLGKAGAIKAGSYEVGRGVTPLALLDKLGAGEVSQAELVFIEGWTFRQMRAALDADVDVKHDSVALSDAEIMGRLGAAGRSPEGLFFPDTYLFGKGTSDLDILKRAYKAMDRQLQAAWQQRAPDLPYRSPYEALIMASVIEKETGQATDRSLIGGVFVNRLRIGMMLQTDPTVIYGLGEKFDGNLRKKDLLKDTPHNTYTRGGLPPTPIAMPGQASLQAALNPAKTQALYFVARGDGSSEFSRTLAEHERAVTKYQRRGGR
ncbi:MAG: endolytic transglycosylase MltG [Betaproteobacteria bacterium]|nr:MAG: endolytic transglycosylase MltG [Betaproteobacteria bacterium]